MAPEIARPGPPYMQITDHYRQQIHDNALAEGARLPTVATIAKEWKVAHATAAKAVAQLQVEGLIVSSPRGSFVAGKAAKASTPQDRWARLRRTGTTSAQEEHHTVRAAAAVNAPTYVGDLFDIDPPARVIRREVVTGEAEGRSASALTVTWYREELGESVPDLLNTHPSHVGGLPTAVEAITGPVTRGRDFFHARAADQRESAALGLPVGSAILAGTWLAWTEDETLVEYGEICLPPRSTVSYPYEVELPATS